MILNPSRDYNPQLLLVFQMWRIYKYILGADIKILTKYIWKTSSNIRPYFVLRQRIKVLVLVVVTCTHSSELSLNSI